MGLVTVADAGFAPRHASNDTRASADIIRHQPYHDASQYMNDMQATFHVVQAHIMCCHNFTMVLIPCQAC